MTGGNGVTAPDSRTLTITDDEVLPVVTLALDPASIGERGGVSTVTASLDRPSSQRVTVTVSAAPVSPATTSDFQHDGTTLTIEPGRTASTGTVTIAAVNNTADAPDKSVDVTATVAGGNGVAAPEKQTLTIRDDDPLPEVALALDPVWIDEGGVSTVTATLSLTVERDGDGDHFGGGSRSGGGDRLHPGRDDADDRRRPDREQRDGDHHGRQQHDGQSEQDRQGDGDGARRERRGGAGSPDADDRRPTRARRR